jgi:CBS domain-containing protein
MQVAQILNRKDGELASVTPDTPIPALAAMLKSRGIGAVVVIDEAGELRGIVSERDIVYALADLAGGMSHLTARDLMTRDVSVCKPGHDINDVMRAMSSKRFRHMPVMEDGQVIGVVSIGDAVRSRIEELEHERQALEELITG